jgi:uncharacterized protein YbjT (DUF2867 family)
MQIIMAGASGLVGGHLARLVPSASLTLIGRREVAGLDRSVEQCVAPAESWADLIRARKPDVAISALGTTLRQAGSKAAFRAVDFDLIVTVAKAARTAGVRQFLMVSSVGADATSSSFYLKTKGEAEDAVRGLGFARVDIFRPGLLRGERGGPTRFGERIAMAVSPLTDRLTPGRFDKYRSTGATDVAAAMARLIGAADEGVFVHHNREIAL